jgi:two-component system, NtrC family, sensor kinase
MSLGNRLTLYLLVVVVVVTGLDMYLSLRRTRANLVLDVHRELSSIARTLRVTLEKAGDDAPERYFAALAPEVSSFPNILGVAFYGQEGQLAFLSPSLHDQPLPNVDIRSLITSKAATEGVFTTEGGRRYYRVEPIVSSTGTGIGAFLLLEDFPIFTQEFRSRAMQTLLTTLALLAILATVTSLVVRQSVTRPLQTFSQKTIEIGQGQFNQQLHRQFSRNDEIGLLAYEFDRMCEQLQEARQQLLAESDEKVRLARELRHSEKLATVGQLASRLAHEMGTPLNIIRGRAQQLLQRESLEEQQRVFLSTIVSQIERISRFIRQLLTLARRPELRLRPVQLNDIVQRTWETIGERSAPLGVVVNFNLASGLPSIWADPDQLQQVFLNLYVNAIQAIGNNGTVTVSTRIAPPNSSWSDASVEVEFADTGPGIAPQDMQRIFEPFFTTKNLAEGSGLGLAISQDIIQSHHGRIHVESTPGQGSRFMVVLPVADARPVAALLVNHA